MAGTLRSTVAVISRFCCKHVGHNKLVLQQSALMLHPRLLLPSLFHTSAERHGLMEFFDIKKNWGEESVKTGRPWRVEELRIKSNSDLHKLWYVLLKERNMLLTMQHEYEEQNELFPNPERIEKVEESMENIMTVVGERDEAYNLLETGKTGDPGGRYVTNFLGLRKWKKNTEHLVPAHMNKFYYLMHPSFIHPRTKKYVALYREQRLEEQKKERKREKRRIKKLEEEFPHLKGKL